VIGQYSETIKSSQFSGAKKVSVTKNLPDGLGTGAEKYYKFSAHFDKLEN
jgi:hypothetical protein